MRENGKVWLVGAGPGDSGLLTVKGKEVLEEADVIVYDALVSIEILSLLPTNIEKINVGKRANNHNATQGRINQILLEQALMGKKVVRLKGGDPFVFGRGGEELELLAAQRIPFEIIPGITSAVAVPSYAGIPITHRNYSSSFHVITGQARKGSAFQINFASLVELDATLVFLMGISSMDMICEGLMAAGMCKDMPAAVLERGTNAKQRRVVSTIEYLSLQAKKAKIQTPAIIVVGKVCDLSEDFHWAEDRPLGGRQFLITRPARQNSTLAKRLRALGAQVIEMPTITIEKNEDTRYLQSCCEEIGDYPEEWMVFTSPSGVAVFFEQLRNMKFDIRRFFQGAHTVKIAAIGSATARELEQYGFQPDVIPEEYSAKALSQELVKSVNQNARISIFRAREGSELLIPPLEEAGIACRDIPIYETVYTQNDILMESIRELFANHEIDAVTFTSASTVKGFVQTVKEMPLYKEINAVCIGEQTAKEASKYGMKIHISKESSMDSIVELLLQQYAMC